MRIQILVAVASLFSFGCSESGTTDHPPTEQENAKSAEDFPVGEFGLRYDPVINSSDYKQVFEEIDKEVAELLADHPRNGQLGFVHIVWHTKKERLKEVYGIEWKTPSELNPGVSID